MYTCGDTREHTSTHPRSVHMSSDTHSCGLSAAVRCLLSVWLAVLVLKLRNMHYSPSPPTSTLHCFLVGRLKAVSDAKVVSPPTAGPAYEWTSVGVVDYSPTSKRFLVKRVVVPDKLLEKEKEGTQQGSGVEEAAEAPKEERGSSPKGSEAVSVRTYVCVCVCVLACAGLHAVTA